MPDPLHVRLPLPVLAAVMAAMPAQGSGPDDEPTVLEPVIVTQPVSPLDEPYQRLRRMMSDPYCDGCPPLLQADRESVYVKILRPVGWLTGYGLEVPEIGHEDRVDFHLANDWRQYERIPEN